MERYDIADMDLSHLYHRPVAKQLLVNAWIEIHREELVASWHAGRLTGEYLRVDALR